jgi:peptidyl-prolyl cis-trans isomerase SurA
MIRFATVVAASLLAIGLVGCGSQNAGTDGEDSQKVEDKETPGLAEKTVEKKEANVETEGPKPVKPSMEKLSASHILLMHKESKRVPPTVTRSKDEAKKLADEIYKKLKGGADFADLAKEHSDCPSGKRKGGNLGIFPAARMAPEFTEGVKGITVGEITEPVETQFGYHIIKRQEVVEIHARHILLMHAESTRKPTSVTRTKDEAKKLIDEILEKLKGGADFADLAKEHSDCPSGKSRGGDLGTFGKGRMAPPFEEAAFGLEENGVSGIVETDFGYHIIQRLP